MQTSDKITIRTAIRNYLETVKAARSERTAETYRFALQAFDGFLTGNKVDIDEVPCSDLAEQAISGFASRLKKLSPATERLYLTAVAGFYEYLAAEGLASPNLPHMRLLIRQRARRPGVRLPQFPADAIRLLLEKAEELSRQPVDSDLERLRNLRDGAFLITLADTGLRVHEACGLKRGDVDWNELRAVIIGKGDREAVVRFSKRSHAALKAYLSARASLDGGSGKPLASLPLFARHDKGAGKKVQPLTTTSGRNIVNQRVEEFLGKEAVGAITPHSFRHYFVTTVLQASGNLKLAQELARHRSIAVTQRYAHLNDDELEQKYKEIFNP